MCAICSTELDRSFHADHIIPYSKGGLTDVINGQALCAACNLKKGSKMAEDSIFPKSKVQGFKLREWQNICLRTTIGEYRSGIKSFLVNACPAAGKTFLAATLAKHLLDQGDITHIIIVSPMVNVQNGWSDSFFKHFGIEIKNGTFNFNDYKRYQGMSITYQSVAKAHQGLRKFCSENKVLAIIDEIHHCNNDKSSTWGEAVKQSFELATYRFILTGTPWTTNGTGIPFVEYAEDTNRLQCGYEYPLKKAIKHEVCRIPVFHPVDVKDVSLYDHKNEQALEWQSFAHAEAEGKEQKLYDILRNDNTATAFPKLFSAADEQLEKLRFYDRSFQPAGLIVAHDIRTAERYRAAIKAMTGENVTIVHSETEGAQKIIDRFRKSSEKWIIAVDMISEGVDIPRLQVMIYMHRKTTKLFFRQVLGRIIRSVVQRANKEEEPSAEFSADRYCYMFLLKYSPLVDLAKTIEDEVDIALEDEPPPPPPKCQVCGNTPNYNGCGEELCPYPTDLPPIEKRFDLESDSYQYQESITEGQHYPADVTIEVNRIVEDAKRRGLRVDIASIYVTVMLQKYGMTSEEYADKNKESEIRLQEVIALKKKEVSDRVRKIVFARISKKGRKPNSDDFKEFQYSLNRRVGVQSVDEASPEQLDRMIEILKEAARNRESETSGA